MNRFSRGWRLAKQSLALIGASRRCSRWLEQGAVGPYAVEDLHGAVGRKARGAEV